MRRVVFEHEALKHLNFWSVTDLKKLKKIFELIDSIRETPFTGIGQPEPLKNDLQGFWSRRIDLEHHLEYRINDDFIFIAACRNHY